MTSTELGARAGVLLKEMRALQDRQKKINAELHYGLPCTAHDRWPAVLLQGQDPDDLREEREQSARRQRTLAYEFSDVFEALVRGSMASDSVHQPPAWPERSVAILAADLVQAQMAGAKPAASPSNVLPAQSSQDLTGQPAVRPSVCWPVSGTAGHGVIFLSCLASFS